MNQKALLVRTILRLSMSACAYACLVVKTGLKGAKSRYFASVFAPKNYRQIEGNHKICSCLDRKILKM